MKYVVVVLLLVIAVPAGPVLAHDVRHEVGEGAGAVLVHLFYAEGNPFSFESYEVYRAGEKVPFQVGRTDTYGRVVFVPDRPGAWRVKAFSEGGHGVDFSFTTGAGGTVEKAGKPLIERFPRIITGIALVLGLFALIDFFAVRRGKR